MDGFLLSGSVIMTSRLILLGFVIMAGISVVITYKQAHVVDAMGDVAKINAKIRQLRTDMQDEEDKGTREKLQEKIKKLEEKDMPKQREQAMNAVAALPNGAILLTFISQIGAAAFGLGVLAVFMNGNEHHMVRSTCLIVIGAVVLSFITARYVYLIVGGTSSIGGAL